MILLEDIVLWALVVALGAALWHHLGISQRALALAKSYTQERGVTLLDQSVVLRRIGFARSRHSLFTLKRTYSFEFATLGDARYPGSLVMVGKRLKAVELAPFKTEQSHEEQPLL